MFTRTNFNRELLSLILIVIVLSAVWINKAEGVSVSAETSATWTTIQTDFSYLTHALTCTDTNLCIAVGQGNLIARSTNGGQTWQEITTDDTFMLMGVDCATPTLCIASGHGGKTLRSIDTGLTWQRSDLPIEHLLNDITCISDLDCIAVGAVGTVARTDDGGHSWILPIMQPLAGAYLQHIDCFTTAFCMTGAASTAAVSIDQGRSWQTRPSDIQYLFTDAVCLSAQHCIVVGSDQIHRTTDGGQSWTMTFSQGSQGLSFSAIDCQNAQLCVAVKRNGQIIESYDGGLNWVVSAETGQSLMNVHCTSTSCIAISYNGTILKRTPVSVFRVLPPL